MRSIDDDADDERRKSGRPTATGSDVAAPDDKDDEDEDDDDDSDEATGLTSRDAGRQRRQQRRLLRGDRFGRRSRCATTTMTMTTTSRTRLRVPPSRRPTTEDDECARASWARRRVRPSRRLTTAKTNTGSECGESESDEDDYGKRVRRERVGRGDDDHRGARGHVRSHGSDTRLHGLGWVR